MFFHRLQAVWVPGLRSSADLICCWKNWDSSPSERRSTLSAGVVTLKQTDQWILLVLMNPTEDPSPLSLRCMSVYRPVCQFFRALVQPEYSAVTDVYVLMFLADTVDFIIIVFGFWAFGVKYHLLTLHVWLFSFSCSFIHWLFYCNDFQKHSAAADITSSLSEDQVPEAFLVMVLIQFGMPVCYYLPSCLPVYCLFAHRFTSLTVYVCLKVPWW